MQRRNGEGSVFKRKDGRWSAAAFVLTTTGTRKRVQVYGKSYQEAYDKLEAMKARSRQHLPVARKQRLDAYLDYWMDTYGKRELKPKTYVRYEDLIRVHLKPGLGNQYLEDLTVPRLQAFFNDLADELKAKSRPGSDGLRTVQATRAVLSSALTNAMREELLQRNVARLVRLPAWHPKPIYPWSSDEATKFLKAVRSHRLYPAFMLLVLCGMRQGEVLGLRWQDIDFERNEINVRKQLQHIGKQFLTQSVKSHAGERALPLPPTVKAALLAYREATQENPRINPELSSYDLVFLGRTGTPIDGHNFSRTYKLLCKANNIRGIRMHAIRHTTATMLKNLHIPARDTQLILGHASTWMTTQVYQHDDMERRRDHIGRLEDMLRPGSDNTRDHI
jgi:integrase